MIRSLAKTSTIVIVIAIVSKCLGLLRDLVLANLYGTSAISDAFIISQNIPTIMYTIIGSGLIVGFIPMYLRIKKEKGKEEAIQFSYNLLNIMLIISTIICIIVYLFPEFVTKLFASGFNTDTLILSANMLKITIINIAIIIISKILSAFLQSENKFIAVNVMSIPMDIIAIIFIILSSKYGYSWLSIGSVLGYLIEVIILIPRARKNGFFYHFKTNFRSLYIKKMFVLALPVILGYSVNQINILIDRNIASHIIVGGIASLNYANKISNLIYAIVVINLVSIFYTKMTEFLHNKENINFNYLFNRIINIINFMIIPSSLALIVFARPITMAIFERGMFDANSVDMTSNCLIFYSIGIIGLSYREILTRLFYSVQDSKTPLINAIITVLLNIVLNIILSKYLGLGGLALATSISSIMSSIYLFIVLRKKIKIIFDKIILSDTIKYTIISVVVIILSKVFYNFIINYSSNIISLFMCAIIGVLLYILLLVTFKSSLVFSIYITIKEKIIKPKNKV